MSPAAWSFFSVLTTVSTGSFVELVRLRLKVEKTATKEQVAETGEKATTAAEEAARIARDSPLANGFPGKVLASLKTLELGQAKTSGELGLIRQRLDGHIDDHAASDVRRH